MPASHYLNAFRSLSQLHGDKYHLVGDSVIVEEVANKEATKEVMTNSGHKVSLVLAPGKDRKIDGLEMNLPVFVRVLAVGEGWYNEEEEKRVPLEVEVGDIVLVGRMSVNWFSVFGSLVSTTQNQIGITRENEIKMRFCGEASYDKCFTHLNDELSPKF